MTKHYLVTGGAGFIGSHIVEALLKRGDKVRVIDDFSVGVASNVAKGAEVIRGSITSSDAVSAACKSVNGIFHCAALSSVELSLKDPRRTGEVNLFGTLKVILAARKARIKRIVFSSSAAIYGDQPTLPFCEDMKPNPGSPYALEKYASEEYCRIAAMAWKAQTVCLRYFNVYGPRAATEGAYVNVIPIFLRQRAVGEPLTITGKGTNTRDYVYIDDVIAANLLAMDNKKLGNGDVINIGSGVARSVNEIAKYIGGKVVHIPPRIEQAHARADISRAKRMLGWKPQVTFEEGLTRTMEWYKSMKNELLSRKQGDRR